MISVCNSEGVKEPLNDIVGRIVNNTIAIPFKYARKLMWHYLKRDDGLLETYRANVAMRIHDYVGDMSNPSELCGYDHRNKLADEIVELIFK